MGVSWWGDISRWGGCLQWGNHVYSFKIKFGSLGEVPGALARTLKSGARYPSEHCTLIMFRDHPREHPGADLGTERMNFRDVEYLSFRALIELGDVSFMCFQTMLHIHLKFPVT